MRKVVRSRRTLAVLFAGIIACLATVGGLIASAAVPSFPDNLVVFPDRDFVSVEGFEQHAGETALLEVTRGTSVIGSTKALVDGGGIAFEVNHPGGVCWGAGTSLQVTPDIRPGDVVSIKFLDGTPASEATVVADTTVGDAFVTQDAIVNGTTLTVLGHIGPSVNPDFIEQRIVNPDLVDTPIARRSISAIPGPLTPDPRGTYSSGLTVDTNASTFEATYEFLDTATAQVAANSFLGERAMSWQEQDPAGNRQGLTIAEFGEPGGPGMGGCPAGPNDLGSPVAGSAFAVRKADTADATKDQVTVDWAPVTAAPGAAPVTGYSIAAIGQTANTAGERPQSGTVVGPNLTRSTIHGLTAAEHYTVEVRSISTLTDGSTRLSAAFPLQVPVSGDTTAPTLTATPNPGTQANPAPASSGVTLNATDTSGTPQIYYTTDGSAVLGAGGDLPSDTAVRYAGPIPVTDPVNPIEIHAVALDAAGNHSALISGYYKKAAADPVPAAPVNLVATAGQASVILQWGLAAPDSTITGYGVQLYKNGIADGALRETTARNLTISGLTVGASYTFTVKAKNAVGYGAESAMSDPPAIPTPVTDRITITSARWKTNDLRVIGTGSLNGATVTIRVGTATGCSPTATSLGVTTVALGVVDVRIRNNAVANTLGPPNGRVCAFSSAGGVAGPFATTN